MADLARQLVTSSLYLSIPRNTLTPVLASSHITNCTTRFRLTHGILAALSQCFSFRGVVLNPDALKCPRHITAHKPLERLASLWNERMLHGIWCLVRVMHLSVNEFSKHWAAEANMAATTKYQASGTTHQPTGQCVSHQD